jgi:hypothetical protein
MTALPNWFSQFREQMTGKPLRHQTARRRIHPSLPKRALSRANEPELINRSTRLERLLNGLRSFLEVPVIWPDALPTEQEQVELAASVLSHFMSDETPAPFLVPTSSGGIQMEWHLKGIDVEIETLSGHSLAVYFYDSINGVEWQKEVTSDWTIIGDVLSCLSTQSTALGE